LDIRSQLDTGGVRVWHQEGSGAERLLWAAPAWAVSVSPQQDDHRLGIAFGDEFRVAGELDARDGGLSRRLEMGVHRQNWSAVLGWGFAGRGERWSFTQVSDTNRLELDWNSEAQAKTVELELRPGDGFSLRAGTRQEDIGFGHWSAWGVGDSGHASSWTLGAAWEGDWGRLGWNGLWRNSRLVTVAWKNDDGERRTFHELAWGLDRNCQELAWSGRLASASAGAERVSAHLERPHSRGEFLFWNALDGSAWTSMLTALYSRSDYVDATLSAGHQWLELKPRMHFVGWLAVATLRMDHLDLEGEMRWRRREIRGFEMSSRKDTTGRQVDLWLLRPGLDLERRFGTHWTLGMGGTAAVPLWVSSKNRPGSGEGDSTAAGAATQSASLSGGWAVSAWARFRL